MTLTEENEDVVEALRVEEEIDVSDFGHEAWAGARVVPIERYWSGERAPEGRRAEARVLWDAAGLGVRFAYRQEEPWVVAEAPRVERKTVGLWERDVCELYVAPNPDAPERYYEFEVAPTGEWLDLAIEKTDDGRETDWDYRSGMAAAARVEGGRITILLRVPWEGLGARPRAGESWRGNLYRCVGAGATRGYLAWRPTLAPEPNFHVPERFGRFKFV